VCLSCYFICTSLRFHDGTRKAKKFPSLGLYHVYGCIIRYFPYEPFFICAYDYVTGLCRVAQIPLDTRDGVFMCYKMLHTSIPHLQRDYKLITSTIFS
jgi:hypothetical protein